MKKRLISLLLVVCMVTVLFACLGTTAAAVDDRIAGYLVSYTLKTGDTVMAVCGKLGIDFARNAAMIQKVNGIVNYNYLLPGTMLWLPSPTPSATEPYYTLLAHTLIAGETPAALCRSYGIDYASSYNMLAALNNNMTTFMAGQEFILPEYVIPGGQGGAGTVDTGDRLKYYLAQRVIKTGETVGGICAELGVDFGTYDEMIRRLNNIVNYNHMFAGQLLLIPSPTQPTSGSYYRVMEHTVLSGETLTGLCIKYGLDYGAFIGMIQNLNNRADFTMLYPGDKILLPSLAGGGTDPGTGGGQGLIYITPETGTGAATPTPAPPATPVPAPGTTPAPAAGTETGTGLVYIIPETGRGATAPVTGVTGATGTTTGTATGTTTGTPTGTGMIPTSQMSIPANDTVSYLLIAHTLKAGETVAGVCAAKGINFDAYAQRIAQLNNIVNYNYMFPGTVVLLPTTAYPTSGPYYKVMAHVLVPGDTVYDLCTKYGLVYDNAAGFIQRLNNRDYMQPYYVGETILMPVYVAG